MEGGLVVVWRRQRMPSSDEDIDFEGSLDVSDTVDDTKSRRRGARLNARKAAAVPKRQVIKKTSVPKDENEPEINILSYTGRIRAEFATIRTGT